MAWGSGMNELLEVIGYKQAPSGSGDGDVAEDKRRLTVTPHQQEEGEQAQHCDPTDLPSWVHEMISDMDNEETNGPFLAQQPYNDDSDLRIIPGLAAVPLARQRADPTEENAGVHLAQALMMCGQAVEQGNLQGADMLLQHVGALATSQGGPMRKVAYYFAHALALRIYGFSIPHAVDSSSLADMLHDEFYETSPYLKFAHFAANQAILQCFAPSATVHIIDFALRQGMQWPALMQALALRPGGPPLIRVTGIGPPRPEPADSLQQVGWKLAQIAHTLGIRFEFRGFVCNSLADLDPFMLDTRPGETVAVNAVFELHRLLARPGALEKVLNTIGGIEPDIITVVEQEAYHNNPVFFDRFMEALHYYSNLFDSMQGSFWGPAGNTMADDYLGRQICNVLAYEGEERVERHETLNRWRVRLGSCGIEPFQLNSEAHRQASMLLAMFTGQNGFVVEESHGCLMLGWQSRALISMSAWRVAAAGASHCD